MADVLAGPGPPAHGRRPGCGGHRDLFGSPRPDLTTIPLHGVEPSHVVLATRAGDRGRLVGAFRKCAQAHLTGPG
jgi:hypothetical protein